jgi:hypothetical protein
VTGTALSDARLQLHHAAQFLASFGISYLEKKADDSHTNMEWSAERAALVSNPAGRIRLGIRPRDLTLLLLENNNDAGSCELRGRTIADAADWIRRRLSQFGLDGGKYTLARHYEIPHHAVDDGQAFDASRAELTQLEEWFSLGAELLEEVRVANSASPVRCWPHHFDIGTLIDVAPGKSIGAGLEPGDQSYDEPYWYVNAYPAPAANAEKPPLGGGGCWHTADWVGAVLPASRIDEARRQPQSREFLESAVSACRAILDPRP